RTLGQLDHNGVFGTLVRVILRQLHAQPSRLYTYGGVALRIEAGRPAQNFRGDLVFLQGGAGMIEGVFGEVMKEFAEGFGATQAMTINKLLYLLEALLPSGCESTRQSHVTTT